MITFFEFLAGGILMAAFITWCICSSFQMFHSSKDAVPFKDVD